MSDINNEVSNIVNKTLTLNNSQIVPKKDTWRLVIIGGIGFAIVLLLLFVAFFIKSLLYVIILLVIVIVAFVIVIGVLQLQSKKE